MPFHPNTRSANPALRQIACLVVGFGCLTTAGHVLSSVVKAPAKPEMSHPEMYPGRFLSVYAVPSVPSHAVQNAPPLQALVCVRGRALQITNNSPYPWHNLRAEVAGGIPSKTHSAVCPVIAPYRTRTILLRYASQSQQSFYCGHGPVVLQWECRTGEKKSRWYGYMPM